MNARKESFLLSQVALAMAAGGGSSGDGTPWTAGPFSCAFFLMVALGRLPLVQEGSWVEGLPFGTGAATNDGRTGLRNPAGHGSSGEKRKRERVGFRLL
ncbi:hypothetical protein ACLB2K_072677 [Fragaria x ananassa]